MIEGEFYDYAYYEDGLKSGKSLYENYRWLPNLTLPLAEEILQVARRSPSFSKISNPVILDYGCAKGYLVKAMNILGVRSYGIDVSSYAIANCHPDVEELVVCLDLKRNPYPASWPNPDYIIAKDVLEHHTPTELPHYLKELHKISSRILVVVPLGDGEKYFIEEYGNDPSHFIKEDLNWWEGVLTQAGFKVTGTYDVGGLKATWKDHHQKGNGLLYCSD